MRRMRRMAASLQHVQVCYMFCSKLPLGCDHDPEHGLTCESWIGQWPMAISCGPLLSRCSSSVDQQVKRSSKVDQSRPKSAMRGLASMRTAFSSQLLAADDPDFTQRPTAAKLWRLNQIRWKSAEIKIERIELKIQIEHRHRQRRPSKTLTFSATWRRGMSTPSVLAMPEMMQAKPCHRFTLKIL